MIRALTVITAALAASLVAVPAQAVDSPPRTGFEQSNGARWTTEPEEQDFLAAVDKASDRVSIARIGTTKQGRPSNSPASAHPTRPPRSCSSAPSTATNRPAARPV